jgi:tetratricopeptide (TPR) repeat protein
MNESLSLNFQLHNLFLKVKDDLNLNPEEINNNEFTKISVNLGTNWFNLYKAELEFKKNNYSESKKQTLEVINNNTVGNLILAEANALLGRIARLHRLFEDAQNFYVKAEEYFALDNNSYGKIRMKYNMANIFLIKSSFPEALTHYQQILEVLEDKEENIQKENKISLQASVLQNIGIIKMYQGELKDSTDHFEKAKKILVSLGKNSEKALADLLLNYANLARTLENRDLIKNLLLEAHQIYVNFSNVLASKVFIDLVRDEIVFDKQIPSDPLLIESLIENWTKVKSQEAEIRMEEITTGLFDLGSREGAVKLANHMLEQNVDISTQGKLIYLLAKDYFFKEKYKESIELCDQVLKICSTLNDDFSATGVESTIILANYLIDKDYNNFKNEITNNLVKKRSLKDEEGLINILSQIYGLVSRESFRSKDKFILELMENYELPIIKKSKDKNVLKILKANLSFVNFLYDEKENAIKIAKKEKLSYEQILEMSPFSHYFEDQQEIKSKFEALFRD